MDIVDLVTTSVRFAPHFHLPLQHASDVRLRAMRRPYTLDYYRRLVTSIRLQLPYAGIGSDMIVGFPGETESEFESTREFLAASPLTYLHVFPYSDRPGTKASRMRGKVSGQLIRERARLLRAVGNELADRFRRSQVGTVRPGLTLTQDEGTVAVTDNYLKVRIPSGCAENQRVNVRITAAAGMLTGEVVATGPSRTA